MPKIKKAITTDKAEIQTLDPKQVDLSLMTPISTTDNQDITKSEISTETENTDINPEIQAPLAKIPKKEFKQLHIKDILWLENDIFQTIADMTEGKKTAKALIINEALKDYLNKGNIEIKPLRVKAKKYK